MCFRLSWETYQWSIKFVFLKILSLVDSLPCTWRIIPFSKWLGSPPFARYKTAISIHFEGEEPQVLGTYDNHGIIDRLLNRMILRALKESPKKDASLKLIDFGLSIALDAAGTDVEVW